MAEDQAQAAPPLPPRGAVVSEQALYLSQISLYRNTLAFGGTRNPTAIWASMTYNEPWMFAFFRELEEKDEDVGNALDDLKLSVMSREMSLQPANEDDSRAVDVKDFVEQQLQAVGFDDVLDNILDAPGYGFSVQEMMFDVSAGQVALTSIDDCPQDLFLFGNRFRPQVGNLQYLEQPFAAEGIEVPESKFLITTYRKRSGNRMGRPLLKNVFWPSWFKRNVERLWLQFAEKGPGTAVVRYNDPDSAIEKQRAAEIAQAIVESTAISVPKSFEIETELLKIARSQQPSVYKEFYTLMQYAITRRILGETLTSFGNEGGRGSNAQGQTHAETKDQRSKFLAKMLMKVVNRQVVRPLVLWNFGPDAPMPKWTVDIEEKEDLQARLTIDAGLQKMGKKFTAGYVADRYGVPLVKDVPKADGSDSDPDADGDTDEGETPETVLKPSTAPVAMQQPTPQQEFAEGSPRQQATREMKEFDDLFAQLHKDATGIFEQRTREIAGSVVPVVRG